MKVLIYLAFVALLVGYRPLREMFFALDPWRRGLLAGLFVLLLTGQIVAKKYPTYPFVKWGMYDEHSSRIKYFEYTGVRSDGSEAPFPIAHLIRTHSTSRAIECPTCGKRLLWRLRELGKQRRKAPKGEERRALKQLYRDLLRGAWRTYKRRHPDADFEQVIVSRATLDVTDYVDESSIERERLWKVDLLSDAERENR